MVTEFGTRSKRLCLTFCGVERKLGRRQIKKTRENGKLRKNGKRNALAQSIDEESHVAGVNKSDVKTFAFEKL